MSRPRFLPIALAWSLGWSLAWSLAWSSGAALAQPPVRVAVEPGVPPALGETARAVASAALPFLARDLGLPDTAEPVDVVVAVDGPGMRAAGRRRGQRVAAGASTAGVTRGDTLYLNAKYFLVRGKSGPRPAADVAAKVAEVTSHELTHVLVNRASRHNMPRWLNEGLAVNECARYIAQVKGAPDESRRFVARRLAPLKGEPPIPLEELEFGKEAAREFYGAEHRACYASSFAAVLAMSDAFGQARLGALVRACGQGLPHHTTVPERRLRWYRALRTTLNRDAADLTILRDDWVHAHAPPVQAAPVDDDMPAESDPD